MNEHLAELAEAARAELARRNLSEHGAHLRTGLSRDSLRRMLNKLPTTLENVERFARAFDLDINQWRQLAGYPPVESPADDGDQERLAEARDRIRQQLAEAGVPLPPTLTGTYSGGAGSSTVDGIIGDMEIMAELLMERHRRTKGGE